MCRVAVGLGVIPSDTWSTGLHGSMLDSEDAVILGSCIWGNQQNRYGLPGALGQSLVVHGWP